MVLSGRQMPVFNSAWGFWIPTTNRLTKCTSTPLLQHSNTQGDDPVLATINIEQDKSTSLMGPFFIILSIILHSLVLQQINALLQPTSDPFEKQHNTITINLRNITTTKNANDLTQTTAAPESIMTFTQAPKRLTEKSQANLDKPVQNDTDETIASTNSTTTNTNDTNTALVKSAATVKSTVVPAANKEISSKTTQTTVTPKLHKTVANITNKLPPGVLANTYQTPALVTDAKTNLNHLPATENMTIPVKDHGEATYKSLPLITNPNYLRPPSPPVYPRLAKRKKQQGVVIIRAKISTVGSVDEVQVYESSGFRLLDNAAISAAQKWAFVPASRNGEAMIAWVQVPVRFTLNK